MIQQLMFGGTSTFTFTNGGAKYFQGSPAAAVADESGTTITPGIPVSSNITIFFSGGDYDLSGSEQEWSGIYINGVLYRPNEGGTYTYNFSGTITHLRGTSQHPDGDPGSTYIVAIDGATNWTYVNSTTITIP